MAFSDLATEVTWCHCMYFIVVLVKAGANLPNSRGQDIDPTSQGEEWLRIWDSRLQHYLISLPSDNLLRKYELQPHFTDEDSQQPTPGSELQIIAHTTHCLSFLMPSFVLKVPQPPPPAQIPWVFFPHLFLLVYLLWISFVPISNQSSPASGPGMEISRKAALWVLPVSNVSYLWALHALLGQSRNDLCALESPLPWGSCYGAHSSLCHWPLASPSWESKPHQCLSIPFTHNHQVPKNTNEGFRKTNGKMVKVSVT